MSWAFNMKVFLVYWKIVLFFIILSCSSFVASNVSEDCRNPRLKCTINDPREVIYHYCKMYSKDWTLWCNQSKIEKIPEPEFILPYMSCSNATAIYIDDSCLKEVDKDVMRKYPNISQFLCGKNFIRKLPEELFSRNKKLKEINFCGNEISVIKTTAFKGLSQLEILNLAGNKLSHIPHFLFHDLNLLRELSFHDNKIETLQHGVFKGLRNLKILTLTANKISYIDGKALSGLHHLTHLHLDENKLTRVDDRVFGKLVNLQILTLSYNNIENWSERGEDSLLRVHTLNLAFNSISKFGKHHVMKMSKLQNLSLENNLLTSIFDDLFVDTPHLRYLNVADNNLTSIGRHSFSHLCHLETLVLRNNKLRTPHLEWFERIVENDFVYGNDVSENEWNCSCEVTEYKEFLQRLKEKNKFAFDSTSWSNILEIICQSPENLRHQSLSGSTIKAVHENQCGYSTRNASLQFDCSEQRSNFEKILTTYQYKNALEFSAKPLSTKIGIRSTASIVTPTNGSIERDTDILSLKITILIMLLVINMFLVLAWYVAKSRRPRYMSSFKTTKSESSMLI